MPLKAPFSSRAPEICSRAYLARERSQLLICFLQLLSVSGNLLRHLVLLSPKLPSSARINYVQSVKRENVLSIAVERIALRFPLEILPIMRVKSLSLFFELALQLDGSRLEFLLPLLVSAELVLDLFDLEKEVRMRDGSE